MQKTNNKKTNTKPQNKPKSTQKSKNTTKNKQSVNSAKSNVVVEKDNKASLDKRKIEKEELRQKKIQTRQEQREKKLMQRKQKESQRAKERSKIAKQKQEEKEKKAQALKAKEQAAKRKKTAAMQQKAKMKQEKQNKRQELKNMTPSERKKIAERSRAEKSKLKAQNKAYRERLKEEKKEAAKLEKEARRAQKKTSPAIGGWLAAVIALGVSVLALGSMLLFNYRDSRSNQLMLSNTYEKSFYDLVGYMDSLDNNLAKLKIANTRTGQQKLLTDIAVQAELAGSNLQQLPIDDQSKHQTVGFINSISDYSKALVAKVASGETLSEKEQENIVKISQIVGQLKGELSGLAQKTANGYSFKKLRKGKDKDMIIAKFGQLESSTVEYPKLIYDGPFSAALNEKKPKALEGLKEISKEEAQENFKNYFSDYKFKNIAVDGQVNSRAINAYNVSATLEGGNQIFAQISQNGGKLVMFDVYSDCKSQNFDKDTCVSIAMDFLEKIGFKDMYAVWISDSANVADINFAYKKDDVIVYSDLVKVKVCEEKGAVLGIEATSYYLNHTEDRQIESKLSQDEAMEKVSSKIDIKTARLAIIPTKGGDEVAAYEFMGTYEDSTYYVYIDANSGLEADVFRVVKSTEGELLM